MSVAHCTHHCGSCQRHFTSLEAFDRHRVGSFRDPSDPRRCESPIEAVNSAGEPVMEIRDPGACTIVGEKPALVWGLVGARERAAAQLRKAPLPGSTTGKGAKAVRRSGQGRKSALKRAA
jgi:hypothetical protein